MSAPCRQLYPLRPRQNRRHFADEVFKSNFLNENVWIPIKFLLKYVPKGPINNIPALVQMMAWCWTGDKPLSEPMMTQFSDTYMRHSASVSRYLAVVGSLQQHCWLLIIKLPSYIIYFFFYFRAWCIDFWYCSHGLRYYHHYAKYMQR